MTGGLVKSFWENPHLQLRFPSPRQRDTFWEGHRPINRYSIGDPTNGLKYDEDGALTVYIQNASPGKDKESNWLPARDGPFG
ncbi:MAG: hypothetical protein AMK74_00125 [Nitrospira bacterium SM23_35]|nr:MAG: hypothetical protein AMK74_00125 [Nitrospira bacterium SM23_35]